jgi:acetyl esterase/lipase
MKRVLISVIVMFQFCQSQEFFPLWPAGKVPNSKGLQLQDSIFNERIYQVKEAGMWAFFPSIQENKGAAVLICPGGGYERLAYVASGLQLAKWYNTFGVAAFVLKYRLPNSPDLVERSIAPLQDAQRAMRIIRSHAKEWKINSDLIGVMGVSAGGHLASTLGTQKRDVAVIDDSLQRVSPYPNFMILISPVIDFGTYAHIGSRNNLLGANPSQELIRNYSNQWNVSPVTPPSFIVHAVNDKSVPLQNSLLFHRALIDSGVSASLHVFPQGAHVIGLRNNPGSTEWWTTLCESWMREMGYLNAVP